MSMIMRKLNHNYCFYDIFKSHAWYISDTLDKTPFTQRKKFSDLYIFSTLTIFIVEHTKLTRSKWLYIGLVLLFCELGQYPSVILTKYFNFCHNYFSYFKHYFNRPPPSSSIRRAPLNKARILKYSRKCDESLSSTLWKRKVWVALDCV